MLLTERQVAEQLHIKPCTIRNERLRGEISYVRIRSRYYYIQEHIDEYISAHTAFANANRKKGSMAGAAALPPPVNSLQLESQPPSDAQKRAARERIEEILRHPPRKSR